MPHQPYQHGSLHLQVPQMARRVLPDARGLGGGEGERRCVGSAGPQGFREDSEGPVRGE